MIFDIHPLHMNCAELAWQQEMDTLSDMARQTSSFNQLATSAIDAGCLLESTCL